MADLQSRPYGTADPSQHCEKCVFGTGEHAEFCVPYTLYLACEARLMERLSRAGMFAPAEAIDPKYLANLESRHGAADAARPYRGFGK